MLLKGVHDALRKKPPVVRAVAGAALRGSLAFTRARRRSARRDVETLGAGLSVPARLRAGAATAAWPLHRLAHALVYRKMHELTGERLLAAFSGGGLLPAHVDDFFDAAGISVLIGYGLTETSPVVAARRLEHNVIGTIGVPIRDTECRVRHTEDGRLLGEDEVGEIEVRGPQVMAGYWQNDAATQAAFTEDGWFRTGDLCRIAAGGHIVFCGRAKDTIVLSGGENVEPEPLEQAALASPLIAQIVIVGQDRRTLGALVWPDPDAAVEFDPAAVLERVRLELRTRLGPAGGFRPWEAVARVALLPSELSVETGTLTPTLKTRRQVVHGAHAALVDSLY